MSFTPRIVMPGFFIKQGKVGGAENQFYNLAIGMAQAGAKVTVICFDEQQLSDNFTAQSAETPDLTICYWGRQSSRFIAEQKLLFSDQIVSDTIIFPNYFTPPVRRRSGSRVATIIHDCQYLHFPQYFPAHKKIWLRLAHKNTLARADKVIVLSISVLDDIKKFYGQKHIEKISVIGNPISWERFVEAPEKKSNITDRYILSVAHHWAHKNLDTLIHAFKIILKTEPDIKLVLVGQVMEQLAARVSSALNIRSIIEETRLEEHIIITGFVDDAELGELYRNATVFAFPSLFEGFGMPPVEAMGLGVQTITTRCSSLPEATMGLARYVENPKDKKEWARQLLNAIRKPQSNAELTDITDKVRMSYALKHIGERYLEAIFD